MKKVNPKSSLFFLFILFSSILLAQVFIPFSYWSVVSQNTVTVNECPASALGSLSLNINYGAMDATACSFVGANPSALTGTGACSCTVGVCTVTGLTFLQAFLANMPAGTNYNLSNAFNYSVTRPGGTFSNSQSLIITTGTWTPTCLGSALLLWLDATDGTSVFQDTAGLTPAINSTTVARWNDKSGNSFNATQATAANRPTYFTGVNTYLNFSTNWSSTFNYMDSALSMNGTTGFNGAVGSMFSVVNATSTGGNSYISIMAFRNGGGNLTGFSNPNGTTWGMDWWSNGIYTWNTGATITTGSNAIVGFTSTSGAQTFSLNGTTYTNTVTTTTIPNTAINLTIGNDNCCGNTRYYNGRISELLAMKLNLSASNRNQIEGYLAWKYGLSGSLPAAHTYKSFAP